jgi:plasmid stabilization system protein ParE
MAQVVYAPEAIDHLERAFSTLVDRDAPEAARAAASAITTAIDMLRVHPQIGRLVGDLRELVISFGRTGYVALYDYRPALNEVRILAIRHQRELDFP